MQRRVMIRSLGIIGGHVLFPSVLSSFVSGCRGRDMSGYTPVFFTEKEFAAIKELIDIIIPATTTASASVVNTHIFLDQVFKQCLDDKMQAKIHVGINEFMPLLASAADKHAFVSETDKQSFEKDNKSLSWYRAVKKYTLIGYFTSAEGSTKASSYVKIPDEYKADIRADEHTLNYANTSLHF